jgi:glycosyltransferase involved in cell wall biosynthesis
MSLSIVVNTRNVADTLARTLESIKNLADEIVIVDMKSDDDTLKVAKKFTDKIFDFENVGYVEPARNYAISKATSEWILILDADEEIGSELADQIRSITSSDSSAVAYLIPRKNLVFTQWLKTAGWWPDHQLRLFKKGSVEWSDQIHSQPKVTGQTKTLPAEEKFAIIHHNYQSLEQFVEKLNNYTSHEVDFRKTTMEFTPAAVVKAFKTELFSRLFQHKGIDGGMHGTSLSFLQAMYEVIVILKQWQRAGFTPTENDQQLAIEELQKFQKDLNYWIADWHCRHDTGLNKIIWFFRRKFQA